MSQESDRTSNHQHGQSSLRAACDSVPECARSTQDHQEASDQQTIRSADSAAHHHIIHKQRDLGRTGDCVRSADSASVPLHETTSRQDSAETYASARPIADAVHIRGASAVRSEKFVAPSERFVATHTAQQRTSSFPPEPLNLAGSSDEIAGSLNKSIIDGLEDTQQRQRRYTPVSIAASSADYTTSAGISDPVPLNGNFRGDASAEGGEIMDELVSRLQRDLASAMDSKHVSQSKLDELGRLQEKTVAELEALKSELSGCRRQLSEAQRSEVTCQNDLSVAVRQGAKLSKQYEQSQADVGTLKADVYKLGQQLLESMNAQDDLMDQSMLLLKQRDEAYRARDEARKDLEKVKEEHTTGSASSSSTQLAGADAVEAMRMLRDTAIEQRQDTARHLAASREECQELRSRLAAKERLLQEQCRRMYGRGASDGSGGNSSSDGSHSDGSCGPHSAREMHQDLMRLKKELKAMADECDLLRQQCLVAKKERADSLTEQETIISRSYRLQQDMDGMKEELATSQQAITKLKAELAKGDQNLKHAQKEKLEAQQSRDWAFEERSRIINERDMARADTTELQRSRDKAVSDHVATMRDADSLRHEVDNLTKELHNCRALRDCYQSQLDERALYWQADYATREVQIRKGLDGQLGFTIGGGQDNPDMKLGSYIQVVDVVKDGPADGILNCSDLLIMVNNQDLTHVEQASAATMLREATSPLRIVLRRQVENAPFEVRLQGYKDYGIQLESHIVVTGLTDSNSMIAKQFNVQPGDRILKVDNMPVTNVEIGRVTHSIKTGKRNNPIRLTLFRPTLVAVRRPFSAALRSRSMGSGSGTGPPASAVPSSFGVPSTYFGDSVSNMVPSAGERLSLDDSDYVPSSGHGTMSSNERYTPHSHDRHVVSHRGVLSSIHSRTSSSGSGGDHQSRITTASVSSAPTSTTASAVKFSKSYTQVAPAISRGGGGSRTQSLNSGSDQVPAAGFSRLSAIESSPMSQVSTGGQTSSNTGTSSSNESVKDNSEGNPLLESVKQGEQRLQAIQRSRARNEANVDEFESTPSTDDKTRSMPANITAPYSTEAGATAAGRHNSPRRGSLPPQSKAEEQERRSCNNSVNSSESSSSVAAGSATSSFIEAGVSGNDSVRSLAIRSTSTGDGQRNAAIRFVVLSRNPTSGTLGFCIQGGNSSGIFISQITDASASHGETSGGGLQVGDRILEVNGTVLSNATREMAASCLRQSTTSVLITVKNDAAGYKAIKQPYDSVWYRAKFAFLASSKWQLTFAKGSLLHVIDTMPKKPNFWEATLYDSKGRSKATGMIPNRITVMSNQMSGVTGLEKGADPFSDAEPPQERPAATSGVASTVF
eukprot:scpid12503/ scgid22055/ Disks large homolog 5; Discs large protein P-dlg; Placenta and prostate DLG